MTEEKIVINIPLNEFEIIQKEWIKEVLSEVQPQERIGVELITRKECAKILGISLVTLNVYTKKGLIPGYRIGVSVRYKKKEVIESLQKVNKYERRRDE